MTIIYLIRHGESMKNSSRIVQRENHEGDNILTPKGQAQAEAVASELASVPFSHIFTSPIQRAVMTAEIVSAPHAIQPIIFPQLREKHKGDIEHMTVPEHLSSYGDWDSLSEPERWMAKLVPSEESMGEVYVRAQSVLRELAALYPVDTIACVSHGGVMRTVYTKLAGKTLKDMWKFDNCGYMVLDVSGGQIDLHEAHRVSLIDRSTYVK